METIREIAKLGRHILLLVICGVIFWLGYKTGRKEMIPSPATISQPQHDTIIVVRTDTIIKKIPVYKKEIQKDTLILYFTPEQKTFKFDTTTINLYYDGLLTVKESASVRMDYSTGLLSLALKQEVAWASTKAQITVFGENIKKVEFSPKSISEMINLRLQDSRKKYWLGGGVAYTNRWTPILLFGYNTKNLMINAIAGYHLVGCGITINF